MSLQSLLDELAGPRAPGAVVGVLHDGEVEVAATGITSMATKVGVTPDTLFQIGSITKVWTATLLMQAGVPLDAYVRDYVPHIDERITVRHLLTHTSGLPDVDFGRFGRGDDCIELLVGALDGMEPLHAPGAACSYCNTGFVVAGRIVELVDGEVWDAVLRRRIIEPLGLSSTVTLPEEALRFRAAVGHERGDDGADTPARVWTIPRSAGPAGLICSTAEELLAFARVFLGDGSPLLEAGQTAEMLRSQSELAAAPEGPRGLAWGLHSWGGELVASHDGGTIGQMSFLRVVPSRNFALCLLTNGYGGALAFHDIAASLFGSLLGIEVPDVPEPCDTAVDVEAYAGRYAWQGIVLELEERSGELVGILSGQEFRLEPVPFRPVGERAFRMHVPPIDIDSVATFSEFSEGGRALLGHMRGRLLLRLPDA